MILAFIGLVISPIPDWFGVAIFSLIILLTEGLSIDIYAKETTVSTASAPLIAGALLYGPIGALVLSLVLAATSMIKYRSPISRFIFNVSNHIISSSLCAFFILLTPRIFIDYPVYLQVMLALVSGTIIFFSSTLTLAGVMSISRGVSFRSLWKDQFRWLWIFYLAFGVVGYVLILGFTTAGVIGLVAVLVPLLTLRISQMQYIDNTKENVSQLRRKNTELEIKSAEIEELNDELLLSLGNVIDLRDTFTMGHSSNVSEYASLVARELGFSPSRIDLLSKSCLLHDIGKIGIPDDILFKPKALTNDEYEVIKKHPELGAEIIAANQSMKDIAPIIRHHHERYDGCGYPAGLRGEEIPIEARVLCLV